MSVKMRDLVYTSYDERTYVLYSSYDEGPLVCQL